MKLAAPAMLLLAGACSASPVPSSGDLAAALRKSGKTDVGELDVSHIACLAINGQPGEFECRWRFREAGHWADYSGKLAADSSGWTVIDEPRLRP